MTDYSSLLEEGRVRRGRFSREQADECMRIADRDLATADAVIHTSGEWAFNIAYSAMHQAGRAFLFDAGFRAVGEGHHVTVIRFLELGLGPEAQEVLTMLDRMRRKRNRATYDRAGTISDKEAKEAIAVAREFVELIKGGR